MMLKKILANLFLLLILVKFVDLYGKTVYVNPEKVIEVFVTSNGTGIMLTTGHINAYVETKEDVNAVAKKLLVRDGQ